MTEDSVHSSPNGFVSRGGIKENILIKGTPHNSKNDNKHVFEYIKGIYIPNQVPLEESSHQEKNKIAINHRALQLDPPLFLSSSFQITTVTNTVGEKLSQDRFAIVDSDEFHHEKSLPFIDRFNCQSAL